MYNVFKYIGLLSPKISRGNIKKIEKVIKKIQKWSFFYTPLISSNGQNPKARGGGAYAQPTTSWTDGRIFFQKLFPSRKS